MKTMTMRMIPLGLVTGVALTVGSTFMPPVNVQAATATPHPKIVWGANRSTWPKYKTAVPDARGVRIYYDSEDPAKWPTSWPSGAGTNYQLVSMRPDPWPLLHHKYDAYFNALFATAPAHSLFTIWHENAVGNDPLGYSGAVRNPAIYRAMQTYMEHLVQGTRVRFGTIGCGPVNQAEQWYAPQLDWYGYDLYLNDRYLNGGGLRKADVLPEATSGGTLSEAKVWARMTANLDALKKVSHERYPLLRLGESNASPDSYRKNWFTYVAAWFATHDANRPAWILTFWRDGKSAKDGGLSGPWPPSLSVKKRLRYLAQVDH